jgi:ATP-binding cassette, sub-family E, member 1
MVTLPQTFKNFYLPQEDMKKVTAVVEREKCKPTVCKHECMKYDPINRSGGEGFHLGEHGKAEIDESVVTEMHKISAKMCPFEAIKIVKLPEALNKEPIHSYGTNQFKLFNLPIPQFGKVVGVVGRNGMGKSTALKILAGLLKPNLGKQHPATHEELSEYFKGSEAQTFFEKVKKGEITLSYKPQDVTSIPKQYKGRVVELLRAVDERKKLVQVAKALDIEKILEHDIKTISGGELQRVAIAATVLKKANCYVFDEPTSYLDIKQRVHVSHFIRELLDEETSIIVIEHDMIILDYLADLIHVLYGEEGCYGISSQPKSAKAGLNAYLEGYLREENVRFRKKAIEFISRPPVEVKIPKVLASWDNITKSLGHFSLTSNQGELIADEVCGVLGENGIGKTSFMKILAGVEKQDKGQVQNVSVSYKPQELKLSQESVAMVLQEAIKYTTELVEPLNLTSLFEKQLDQLSGGELQRVAVAVCLARNAELYLLDEPSAFLDVEQRLLVSKVIRDWAQHKSCAVLIIDHDLLFLDYLSDRLMVFDGVPAQSGKVQGPYSMEAGMNAFLTDLDITFRRDTETNRPRANKLGSQIDQKQKGERKYYYS